MQIDRVVPGLLLGVAACGSGGGTASAVSRDSAGVTIVENAGTKWPGGKGWVVPDSAIVDIGGQAGDSTGDVDRVVGPVLLSGGRFAIANGGTNEVRIYDAAGKHLASSGRAGSGPGEYQMPTGIWVGQGDSLLVYDVMGQRLSVVSSEGTFGRTFRLGGGTGTGMAMPTNGRFDLALPSECFTDGTVVGVKQTFAINQAREGRYRDSVTMIRYGSDGIERDTLGRFPGTEMETMTLTMGTQSFGTPQPVPLGKQSVNAVGAGRFYVAQNQSWEIEVHDLAGKLTSLIRVKSEPTPITTADADAHRKEQLEAMEALPQIKNLPANLKDQVTARVRNAKYPATFPFLSALQLDAEGNLWAAEVTKPGKKETRYAVVDSSGQLLGRLTLPARFRLTAIGSDRVYGVWKDEEDVEHIRVYPLRKG